MLGEKEPANRRDMNFAAQTLVPEIRRLMLLRRNRGKQEIVAASDSSITLAERIGASCKNFVALGFPPFKLVELGGPRCRLRGARTVRFQARKLPATGDVFLVGSGTELGDWRPEQGIGPLSQATERQLPIGGAFSYKLVWKRGKEIRWQKGENRYLFVASSAEPLTVTVDWSDGA
jgi:hypothetical protein